MAGGAIGLASANADDPVLDLARTLGEDEGDSGGD